MIVDMVKVVMGMMVYGSFSAMNIVKRTVWKESLHIENKCCSGFKRNIIEGKGINDGVGVKDFRIFVPGRKVTGHSLLPLQTLFTVH